ncbi:hypothetical protein KUTeg_023254 [Tegillarca granosa]|uniref:Kinesin motor domain-containing protein n=1 Tax=Tegillarca granosa TaxID=220873 RepID=A0ABQ9E144_TEGGR|nr:hypothetical protein KUTeg_023254 [Tegillarca granosa]
MTSLGQEEKRRCLDLSQCSDTSDSSTTSQKSDTKSRLRSNSSSNLNSSVTKKPLKPSNSTGSLKTKPPPVSRPPVANKTRPTTNPAGARKPVTAVVKPTTSKPVVSKPPPAKGSKPNGSASTSEAAQKSSGGKKRPAWDLKGRLQDMEELVQSQGTQRQMLMIQLDDYNSRIASLESANNQLSGTVEQKEKLATDASRQIDNLRQRLREEEDNRETMKRNLKREIEDLQFLKDTLQRQKDIQLDTTVQEKNMVITENNELKATVASQAEIIENLKSVIREHETTRRKLHNTIQELKGNIRVFCRVRPLLGDERLGNDWCYTTYELSRY